MKLKDTYKTITKPSAEILYKDKNSKFFGYAFPVDSEEKIKDHIEDLKKKHHSARHWCYAYQFGLQEKDFIFRANDDGEPNNSAGMPIYGQIQSFEVTNVLIVVVRYFGGVKLGVGGLIQAYKSAAELALTNSKIVTRTINVKYEILFEYEHMNQVMRIIKEKKLKIITQTLELSCKIIVAVRLNEADEILELFNSLYKIELNVLED